MTVVMGVSGLERNCGKRITLHRENENAGTITIYFDAELCRDEYGRFFITGGTQRTIKEQRDVLGEHEVRDISLDTSHRVYLGKYETITRSDARGVIRKYRVII